MPGQENGQLRDRADRREKGHAFCARAFEGSKAAFADIVKIAALETIAVVIVSTP
jgi:hypothetical protein